MFVDKLQDAKGRMQRGVLIGDLLYVNIVHPDFSERMNTNRNGSRLQITERLCSYIAHVCGKTFFLFQLRPDLEALLRCICFFFPVSFFFSYAFRCTGYNVDCLVLLFLCQLLTG